VIFALILFGIITGWQWQYIISCENAAGDAHIYHVALHYVATNTNFGTICPDPKGKGVM
jgi:hypothetical protein